mmetsp:Transcript_42361/g.122532  ORF Transcript_42361/g.122532 Transcript_42361/m.122532 type:complete len:222 (-) Transcript_42361:249-914(-)
MHPLEATAFPAAPCVDATGVGASKLVHAPPRYGSSSTAWALLSSTSAPARAAHASCAFVWQSLGEGAVEGSDVAAALPSLPPPTLLEPTGKTGAAPSYAKDSRLLSRDTRLCKASCSVSACNCSANSLVPVLVRSPPCKSPSIGPVWPPCSSCWRQRPAASWLTSNWRQRATNPAPMPSTLPRRSRSELVSEATNATMRASNCASARAWLAKPSCIRRSSA